MFYTPEGYELYYDLDKVSMEKYNDGQLLLYTPKIDKGSKTILVVEKMNGYSAKFPGLPKETGVDPFYINGNIESDEIIPISEDSHPEIFVKLGFSIERKEDGN